MIRQRKLSMPFWCVANPVGDPFGPARHGPHLVSGDLRPALPGPRGEADRLHGRAR